MATLADLARLLRAEHGLAVVSQGRADGTAAATVVNAGVLAHPVDGDDVVGFVVRRDTHKLRRLRRDPRVTVTARAGWEWVSVEGLATLAGPDDALTGLRPGAIAPLLRAVFVAAGGTHDDWDTYDRVMAAERRTAVLVRPVRLYGNLRA